MPITISDSSSETPSQQPSSEVTEVTSRYSPPPPPPPPPPPHSPERIHIERRIPNGQRRFDCPECDRYFSSRYSLSAHMRVHPPEEATAVILAPALRSANAAGRGDPAQHTNRRQNRRPVLPDLNLPHPQICYWWWSVADQF